MERYEMVSVDVEFGDGWYGRMNSIKVFRS